MSRNLCSMNSLRPMNPNEMFEQVMRDRCGRLLEVSVLFFGSRKFSVTEEPTEEEVCP